MQEFPGPGILQDRRLGLSSESTKTSCFGAVTFLMSRFYEIDPTAENYWRAIILFGRNTASYKFSLAMSLIDLYREGKSSFKIEELAVPYSRHLCEHLKQHPKQATQNKSTFLDKLREFNSGNINNEEMIEHTLRYGFNYVLDAFHNVHGRETETHFFDKGKKLTDSLTFTDEFLKLGEQTKFIDIEKETEARWQLVESAWENNLPRNLMLVQYDEATKKLTGVNSLRRVSITPARPALNGYQKGRCFYCFREISVVYGSDCTADVDHFFPHVLKRCDSEKPVDGIANLVLACQDCNRGSNGKFDKLPTTNLLERLFNRNEYLINSHHPLRETLIAQTGVTTKLRQEYLQDVYNCASLFVGAGHAKWEPKPKGMVCF